MPADISINLLSQDDLGRTPQGRLIQWTLTYGRYIMILTEIVVLLAFASRFSLDRKLTDLKEEISQKQEIIEANSEFESTIRNLQDRLTKIKTLLSSQNKPIDVLQLVQSTIPSDVTLAKLHISNEEIAASGLAATSQGFSQFLTNLQSTPLLSDLTISNVSKNPLTGITFKLTAKVAGAQNKPYQ